jgi:5-methylcytosine-specific restriction protein A
MLLPISVGDVIDNTRLTEIFKCSTQGGMRRSKETNTLILVMNHVNSIYKDEWQDGIIMYTGMGTAGDQSLEFAQLYPNLKSLPINANQ